MCYKISKKSASEKLALALPLPILFESRRKKLQRFLSLPILNVEKLWFPIINSWLAQNFTLNQVLYLAIDRTSWGRINLMVVSIIYDNRAIPIYFEFLPKLGSSNFTEQTKVFSKNLPLFNKYRPIVLGDREFCSIKLANWLKQEAVQFCLRLKKNEFIEVENGIWSELDDLGLKPNTVQLRLEGLLVI
ncbi:transposase [Tolypothrix campylonemoides VB511288]|nr:transposase [Tolypothrix campylonemoides VB511288]